MKVKKIGFVIIIILVLCIPAWFIYTRFCLNKFRIDGNRLIYQNYVYIQSDTFSNSDTQNLGKTIGIAVEDKRTVTDYIWPVWVKEYKEDKEHNRIFVRGLMDLGSVYTKEAK